MTSQTRAVLKTYFLRGLRPTQDNYGDLIDSFALVSGTSTYLDTTGGVMTGRLQLAGVPVSALEAATKGYVDAIVSAGGIVIGGSNGQVQYNNAGVLGGFTVSGDAASLATTGVLTLANTAVSAGTYVLPTLTVDSKGRVTSATTGSGAGVVTVKKQVFTGSGTYTPSAGMLYCIAEVVGGGGGGGGGTTVAGGGGGAGGYGKSVIAAATIGASQTVTIGGAGAAASGNGNGGTGGTSSLGALISCTGGSGGTGGAGAAGTIKAGGAPGTSSSADLNVSGGYGDEGYGQAGDGGGTGGASFFGGGGRGSAAGVAGAAYGSGGGGGNGTGGAGAAGVIFITEFCSQ